MTEDEIIELGYGLGEAAINELRAIVGEADISGVADQSVEDARKILLVYERRQALEESIARTMSGFGVTGVAVEDDDGNEISVLDWDADGDIIR